MALHCSVLQYFSISCVVLPKSSVVSPALWSGNCSCCLTLLDFARVSISQAAADLRWTHEPFNGQMGSFVCLQVLG